MKSVYHAANSLEAHMLRHVLLEDDIESEIEGDTIREAFGDLQGVGPIHIMVKDHQYEQALNIIEQWKAEEQASTSETPNLPRFNQRFSFIIIAVIFIIFLFSL